MRGLQVKYAELFSLSVEQLFYQNNVYRGFAAEPVLDFVIQPTAECQNVMDRMNLIFKSINMRGGCAVLARVSGTNAAGNNLLRFRAKRGDKLSFLMILKNPEALSFNDLSTEFAGDRLYYFSNEINDPGAPRNNLHLSKLASGVRSNDDTIKKASLSYYYRHPAPVAAGTAKVKHLATGAEIAARSIENRGGAADIAFDLSGLASGKCHLLINNILADEFYYAGSNPARSVFGIIDLSLSPALSANYRLVEPDGSLTAQRPFYTVRFVNRRTLWRYTLQLQPHSPLFREMAALDPAAKADFINRLNVVTNDSTVTFNRVSATDTEFVFVSGSERALQEKYFSSASPTQDALTLTLKKYIGDLAREAAVKTDLPYPSTHTINALTPPFVYSDIFITL